MAGKINRVGTSRPSTASRVAAAKAARAAAVGLSGRRPPCGAVDEVSRPESPASIAIKSLELDGAKAADLKVRVEANERALDDLQKVQSKAGDIADKAAEATPQAMNAAAGKGGSTARGRGLDCQSQGRGRRFSLSAATKRRRSRSFEARKMPRGKSPRSTIKGSTDGWVSRNSAVVSR